MKVFGSTLSVFIAWLALFLMILSPQLFSEGMFMDGIYYATIARNMAEGIGTFWDPTFTQTLGKHFYDHPPLAFGFQSLFFTVFGDHFWVERLYSFLCYVLTALLMLYTWTLIAPKTILKWGVISLFLWISIPKVIWGAPNNLLENTSMIFVLLSVILQIKHLKKSSFTKLFIAGVLLFAGFLTKGFTALFPLSFPFFYALINRSWKGIVLQYLAILIGLLTPLLLLWLFSSEGIKALENYLNIQVLASLKGVQSVDSRFYILRRFFEEILVILLLCVLVWSLVKYWKKKRPSFHRTYFWPLILCGLSGVLPIMISLKQSTFYIIPTFSLFCLAASLFLAPRLQVLFAEIHLKSKAKKAFGIMSSVLLLLAFGLNYHNFGQLKRDKDKLSDIKKIIAELPSESIVQCGIELQREWSYYAYFYRYGKISLSKEEQNYLIKAKGDKSETEEFKHYKLGLKSLDLYSKNPK
ncbi:MAG: glycosyltransferase family 39 protein [Vicingaceae bacterium]